MNLAAKHHVDHNYKLKLNKHDKTMKIRVNSKKGRKVYKLELIAMNDPPKILEFNSQI